MKLRQRKHRLNVSRRGDVRYPWVRSSDFFFISHPVRDWKAEFGNPTNLMSKHGILYPGEIGTVDCGLRFIASPMLEAP